MQTRAKKKIINKNTKKKITTKKQTNKKPQTNKQTNTNKNNVHVTINLGGKLMDGRTVECTTLIRDDYLQDDRNIGNFFLRVDILAKFYIFIHPYFLS